MKLNGLTNNLKDDKSLSNSYLSHIVELLRQEVDALSAKETALEEITNEHIITQKVLVDTKEVRAESVNTNKLQVTSINEKIILSNVIDVLTSLRVNGKDVLTVAAFQGPFTYKGVVETLPETAEAGDVYISNDKVNIFNGTDWDDFILPVGTVSLAEYNEDRAEILSDISTIRNDLDTTESDLANFKADTETDIETIFTDLSEVDTKLENKVDEAPKDDNAYVRKNGEWVEQTASDNTVKSVVGESTIENTEDGVKIESPKVEINTPDFKVNGSELPEVDKLALSRTTKSDDDYSYEIKFGRTPFDSLSSTKQMWVTYSNSYQTQVKEPSQMREIVTKNWHWVKWNSASDGTAGDNTLTQITAINKNGEVKVVAPFWTDVTESSNLHLYLDTFMAFNPLYCPEGYEDTVYMFVPFAGSTNKCFLAEMRDGELVRKYDIFNGPGKLKEQGFVPASHIVGYSHSNSIGGGKALRNKDVNRFCWVAFNVADLGGNYAIIIGGDKNSKITDPFDPNKAIYVPLPATAIYSYSCMAATDSAWYLQEPATGRMMRITPDGQVSEVNLTQACSPCGNNYIEYTDKNGRPACAYYIHNTAPGGNHYVVFLEEDKDGQVGFIERKVTGNTADNWYAQQFKFMENSHYIFFTACSGCKVSGGPNYGVEAAKNKVWYWDKKTHTEHVIINFFEGLPFTNRDWIEMFKTKGNAIWFVPHLNSLAPGQRTGELHFISDIDYTNIDADTGKDEGNIEVQSATVGTNHGFFSSSYNADGWSYYSHRLQGDPLKWDYGGNRQIRAATNDDGILLILSYDFMAFALCYGDGNIKVYEITNHDKRSSGVYDCDCDKIPLLPDEPASGNSWALGYSGNIIGLSHGWLMHVVSIGDLTKAGYTGEERSSWTYFGIQYRNGEPTILIEPRLSKVQRCAASYTPELQRWDQYGYNLTYDDYERRKLTLQGIRSYISYCNGGTGNDGWLKEVKRTEKKMLNLEYDGKIISSVEE